MKRKSKKGGSNYESQSSIIETDSKRISCIRVFDNCCIFIDKDGAPLEMSTKFPGSRVKGHDLALRYAWFWHEEFPIFVKENNGWKQINTIGNTLALPGDLN